MRTLLPLYLVALITLAGCGGGSDGGTTAGGGTGGGTTTPVGIDESKWRTLVPSFSNTTAVYPVTTENAGKTAILTMDAIDFMRSLAFDNLALNASFFPIDSVSLTNEDELVCDTGSITMPKTNSESRIAFFFKNCSIDGAIFNGEMYAFADADSSRFITLNIELSMQDPSLDLNADLRGNIQTDGASDASVLLKLSDNITGEVSLLDFLNLNVNRASGFIRFEDVGSFEVLLDTQFFNPQEFDLSIVGTHTIEVSGTLQSNAFLQVPSLDIFNLEFGLLQSPTFEQDSAPSFDLANPSIQTQRLDTITIDINNLFDADIQPVNITALLTTTVAGADVALNKIFNTRFTFQADLLGQYEVTFTATDPIGLTSQRSAQINLQGLAPSTEFSLSNSTNSVIAGKVTASNDALDGPFSVASYGAPFNTLFNAQTGEFSWDINVPQIAGTIGTSFSFLFNNGVKQYLASRFINSDMAINFAPTPVNVALSGKAQFVSTGNTITVLQDGIPFVISDLGSRPTFKQAPNFTVGLKSNEYIHGLYKDDTQQLFAVLVEFGRAGENTNIRVVNSVSGEQVLTATTLGSIFEKESIVLIDLLGSSIPEIIITTETFTTYAINISNGETTSLATDIKQSYCDVNGDGVKEAFTFNDIVDPVTGISVFRINTNSTVSVMSRSSTIEECSLLVLDDFERKMTFYKGAFEQVGPSLLLSSLMGDNYFPDPNIWQQQIDDDAQNEIFISMRAQNGTQVESATFLLNDCTASPAGCTVTQINDQLISGKAAFTSDIDNDGHTEALLINDEFFSAESTVQMLDFVSNRLISLGESEPQVNTQLTLQSWENDNLVFTQGLEVDVSNEVSRTLNGHLRQVKLLEPDQELGQEAQFILLDVGITYTLQKYINEQLMWELSLPRARQLDDFIIPINEQIFMVSRSQPVFFDNATGEVLYTISNTFDELFFDRDDSDPIILKDTDAAYVLVLNDTRALSYFLKVSANGVFEKVATSAAIELTSRTEVSRADFNQDGSLDAGYVVFGTNNDEYKYVTVDSLTTQEPFMFTPVYRSPTLNVNMIDSCIDKASNCRYSLHEAFNGRAGFSVTDKLTLTEILNVSSIDANYKTLGARFTQNNNLEVLIEQNGSAFLIKSANN